MVINSGTVDITAKDDGINAGQKSKALAVGITVNGGEISIDMGAGDTDAVDSNGYLTITGGVLDVMMESAPHSLNAATPSLTFSIVGLGLMPE